MLIDCNIMIVNLYLLDTFDLLVSVTLGEAPLSLDLAWMESKRLLAQFDGWCFCREIDSIGVEESTGIGGGCGRDGMGSGDNGVLSVLRVEFSSLVI